MLIIKIWYVCMYTYYPKPPYKTWKLKPGLKFRKQIFVLFNPAQVSFSF